ncbi:MAG: hypothetical protein NTY64_08550, partial [Deltaproteobacteria bacterium]|nr:hypothetical protein [Deltaproteobacteria bacterium]
MPDIQCLYSGNQRRKIGKEFGTVFSWSFSGLVLKFAKRNVFHRRPNDPPQIHLIEITSIITRGTNSKDPDSRFSHAFINLVNMNMLMEFLSRIKILGGSIYKMEG